MDSHKGETITTHELDRLRQGNQKAWESVKANLYILYEVDEDGAQGIGLNFIALTESDARDYGEWWAEDNENTIKVYHKSTNKEVR